MRKRLLAIIISVGAGVLIYGLLRFLAGIISEFTANEFTPMPPWSLRHADYLAAIGAALTIWASLEYWRN